MLTGEDFSARGPAAAIDCLRALQKELGYISDETLAEAAAILQMPVAVLDEVATFYNLIFREPVGKNVILLCDSAVCWMLGREALQSRIFERLGIAPGETTADGQYTLLPVVCLGACDRAPVLLVGETLHGHLDAAGVNKLLDGAA